MQHKNRYALDVPTDFDEYNFTFIHKLPMSHLTLSGHSFFLKIIPFL